MENELYKSRKQQGKGPYREQLGTAAQIRPYKQSAKTRVRLPDII